MAKNPKKVKAGRKGGKKSPGTGKKKKSGGKKKLFKTI
jgi:hypothetical protein